MQKGAAFRGNFAGITREMLVRSGPVAGSVVPNTNKLSCAEQSDISPEPAVQGPFVDILFALAFAVFMLGACMGYPVRF